MNTQSRRSGGFTLVELVVVLVLGSMVLILVLAGILPSHLHDAKSATCKNNGRQIVSAVMLFANDNSLSLLGFDPLKCPGFQSSLTFGGGCVEPDSKRIDLQRPLAIYIKDPRVYECSQDRGYSGVAPTVAAACGSVFRRYGSSYAYVLRDEPSCGLMGLTLGNDASKPRKTTDPDLQSPSAKVVIFEPPFAGPAAGIPPRTDRWHSRVQRTGAITFLDGHADWVKASPENHGVVPKNHSEFISLFPKRPYY
ncbi:MAG: prepilin-type N-terminal cleavage/methylation domain-containing protein [Kiritimatiellia bacterium]